MGLKLKRLRFAYCIEFPAGELEPVDYDPNNVGKKNGFGLPVSISVLMSELLLKLPREWPAPRTVRARVFCGETMVMDVLIPPAAPFQQLPGQLPGAAAGNPPTDFIANQEVYIGEFLKQLHIALWEYEHGREIGETAVTWDGTDTDWYKLENIMANGLHKEGWKAQAQVHILAEWAKRTGER